MLDVQRIFAPPVAHKAHLKRSEITFSKSGKTANYSHYVSSKFLIFPFHRGLLMRRAGIAAVGAETFGHCSGLAWRMGPASCACSASSACSGPRVPVRSAGRVSSGRWWSRRAMVGSKLGALALGVGGVLLVGYCIYFDRKRRSDPDFKRRLRERRRRQKIAQDKSGLARLPDLKDPGAVQQFFLDEIQLGEELLAQGDYENGVDHLTNAIAVCGQPHQLLQVLQQTLPPPVFQMLITKVPTISQRVISAQSLAEDDVE